jgi:hypothetical protein
MWTAAIASPSTQSMFISLLAKWINETPTNRAFTDLYNTQTGEYVSHGLSSIRFLGEGGKEGDTGCRERETWRIGLMF